jgi:hypothetical protein
LRESWFGATRNGGFRAPLASLIRWRREERAPLEIALDDWHHALSRRGATNLIAILARSLQADMQAELREIEGAVAIGTRDAGRGVKSELRRQVASAGLGQRLAAQRPGPNHGRDVPARAAGEAVQAARRGVGGGAVAGAAAGADRAAA